MILTEDNLQEWLEELNKIAYERLDGVENYSECLKDLQWLEDYKGQTPDDAIDDEITALAD